MTVPVMVLAYEQTARFETLHHWQATPAGRCKASSRVVKPTYRSTQTARYTGMSQAPAPCSLHRPVASPSPCAFADVANPTDPPFWNNAHEFRPQEEPTLHHPTNKPSSIPSEGVLHTLLTRYTPCPASSAQANSSPPPPSIQQTHPKARTTAKATGAAAVRCTI